MPFSQQETFDIIVAHLRQQNAKAKLPNPKDSYFNNCAYRGENGLKCAAGCLIPDELYKPEFEKINLIYFDNQKSPLGEIIESLGHDLHLVSDLQKVHDNKDVSNWEVYFEKVAEKYSCVYTPKSEVNQ